MIRSDERALAIGIIGFLALIGIAVLLYTLFNPAVAQIIDTTTNATTSTDAQNVIDEREKIWLLTLFYALFLGGVTLIARSVFESRRGF